MERLSVTRTLALTIAFALSSVPALAQHHPPGEDGEHMMERHARMMEMHEGMMADSVLHAHMMADSSMQAAMREVMAPEVAALHARMAAMSAEERAEAVEEMRELMMERVGAMSSEERHAVQDRMMEAHRRLMAHPDVRARMMADPELHEMMERMHEEGMRKHEGGMLEHDHGRSGDTDG